MSEQKEEVKTNGDPKSWVRQWMAIVNTIFLAIGAGIEVFTDLSVPIWYIGIAGPTIGWFYISREIEKWKAK